MNLCLPRLSQCILGKYPIITECFARFSPPPPDTNNTSSVFDGVLNVCLMRGGSSSGGAAERWRLLSDGELEGEAGPGPSLDHALEPPASEALLSSRAAGGRQERGRGRGQGRGRRSRARSGRRCARCLLAFWRAIREGFFWAADAVSLWGLQQEAARESAVATPKQQGGAALLT